MTLVDLEIPAHVRAVRDHLIARDIPAAIGRRPTDVGWAGAPGQSAFIGYVIVWRTGSIEARNMHMRVQHDEARPAVQLTCVGGDADQADEVHGESMAAMLDGTLTIPGRRIQRVTLEVSITTNKDPDETPAVYYAGGRYRIWTLPAA